MGDSERLTQEITADMRSLGNPEIAAHAQRYFKTAPGEYGAGDIFLGIRVPLIRKAVTSYKNTPLDVTLKLLTSQFHEIRLLALLLLVRRFARAEPGEQQEIYQHYLNHTSYINNWDLVDSSAHKIVGSYLEQRDRGVLTALAQSESVWERRIAIIATAHFINLNQYGDTLTIAELLLHDSEDLIHKAVGWMLREVGKRDLETEVTFLNKQYQHMPRTMLRYAIEKFSKQERQRYLSGAISASK